jgi:hypothetical protein
MSKYIRGEFLMNSVKEIEKAVTTLSEEELFDFRQWYEKFDSTMWDEQFEKDVKNGKLDAVAEQAISDFNAGTCTEL